MPTSKQFLFKTILIADFLAELNFIAGIHQARHPDRELLMDDTFNDLQSRLVRSNTEGTPPYTGTILRTYLEQAADKAIEFYGESLESLSEATIKHYALAGVDRIFEFLMRDGGCSWNVHTFFQGLAQGDARRWVLALPDSSVTPFALDAPHTFYRVDKADEARFSAVAAFNGSALANGEAQQDPRESSAALHTLVISFLHGVHKNLTVVTEVLPTFDFGSSYQAGLQSPSLDEGSRIEIASLPTQTTRDEHHERVKHNQAGVALLSARLHRWQLSRWRSGPGFQVFPLQNLQALAPAVALASPTMQSPQGSTDFGKYLNAFLVPPESLDFIQRWFFTTVQQLLLHADPDVSRTVILNQLQHKVTELQSTWLVVSIRLSDLDSWGYDEQEAFLPQYLGKAMGYDSVGVEYLQRHGHFVFLMEGLDDCPSKTLVERLYFGEETAEWPVVRTIFTARKGWKPPNRPQAIPTAIAQCDDWDNLQAQEVVSAAWNDALTNGTGASAKNRRLDFFRANPELSDLVKPFDPLASDKVSPVLLQTLYDLIPALRRTPKTAWPKNRHELYAFGLRHYLGEDYETVYPRLYQRVLSLYRDHNRAYYEIAGDKSLDNWPFLVGSVCHKEGVIQHRYAFTQTSWRDYLIALALWESRYVDTEHRDPKDNLWNQHDLTLAYPGVLEFLGELARTSVSSERDMRYLHRQWVANGPLAQWENAYANAAALAKFVPMNDQALVLKDDLCRNANSMVEYNDSLGQESFVYLSPSWDLIRIEHLPAGQSEVKSWVFGDLGHGAGISPTSPQYLNAMDERSVDTRRYVPIRPMDSQIADLLVVRAYRALNDGETEVFSALAPVHCGFYRQGLLREIDRFKTVITLNEVASDYFNTLSDVIGKSTTAAQAWEALKHFQTHSEKSWLEQCVNTYTEHCRANGGWFDEAGIHQTAANAKALAAYVKQFRTRLIQHMEELFGALRDEVYPTAPSRGFQEGSAGFEARNKPYRVKQMRSEPDKRTARESFCATKKEALARTLLDYQEHVRNMKERNSDLIQGSKKRFELLMRAFEHTRKIWTTYSDAVVITIQQEVEAGELIHLVRRFQSAYLQQRLDEDQVALQSMLQSTLKRHFIDWIEGACPEDCPTEEWATLQQQWRQEDARRFRRKTVLFTALEVLDFEQAALVLATLVSWGEKPQLAFAAWSAQVLALCVQESISTVMAATHKSAWTKLSVSERQAFCCQVAAKFDDTSQFKTADLIEIALNIPQLYPRASDLTLLRYLRFGLAVDACTISNHETLLFYALKRLAERSGRTAQDTNLPLFNMIKHLFNMGPTLLIAIEIDGELITPLAFVERQCQLYPRNTHWAEIKAAMEFFLELLHAEPVQVSRALEELACGIGDVTSRYKAVAEAGHRRTLVKPIVFWRDREIAQYRLGCLEDYPLWSKALPQDLFYLKRNLRDFKTKLENSPTYLFRGRLDTWIEEQFDIFKGKADKANSGAKVPSTLTLCDSTHTPVRSSVRGMTSSQRDSGWSFSVFGHDDAAEAARLRIELAEKKAELAEVSAALATANENLEKVKITAQHSQDSNADVFTTFDNINPPVTATAASSSQQALGRVGTVAEEGYRQVEIVSYNGATSNACL